jgi:hypothetical protein
MVLAGHTERLLMLNNYALAVGYKEGRLPYNDVSCPRIDKSAPTEFMGFNYLIPELDDVSNPTQNNAQDTLFAAEDDEEDRSDEESEELTETEFGDEHDVDVPLDDFLVSDGIDTTLQDAQIQRLNEEEILRQHCVEHCHFIHREIAKLLPETTGTETTLEACKRLTENAAWIPFLLLPGCDTQPTDVDCAEAQLFDEWKSRYKRVGGNPRNNYHAFARDWNIEASRRLTMWSQGDEACVQIRLKSTAQLNEYHDARHDSVALQALVPRDIDEDQERLVLNEQLHRSRESLPITRDAHRVEPTRYVNNGGMAAFGAPTTLNAEVAVGTVDDTRNGILNNASFLMGLPRIPIQQPSRPEREVFRSRRYCKVCCYRKSEHAFEEKPGDNCARSHCGNCRQRRDCHGDLDGWGQTCKLPTHPWSEREQWYEYKS